MKPNLKKRQQRVRQKLRQQGRKRKITVFRSNRHIWAQIVDIVSGQTLVAFSSKALLKMKKYQKEKMSRVTQARLVGQELARLALKKGIKRVAFDRSGYVYHGRVKALAEGARAGGLKF